MMTMLPLLLREPLNETLIITNNAATACESVVTLIERVNKYYLYYLSTVLEACFPDEF